ncbi:MAG TPA: hypothetical protein EYO93_02320, partial [Nitrososphaerales archaeon]|nr:hypothetical protein [Nitrososphaerales archaeon]
NFHTFYYFYYLNHPERYEKHIAEYHAEFLKDDLATCEKYDVDILFQPSMLDVYSNLTNKITLSGLLVDRFIKKRAWNPNLANGYGDIISLYLLMNLKIFNIVSPDVSVIGEKDVYELTSYLKSLIDDLNYSIKLIIAPTIRDSNGVALSSRNAALNKEELINVSSVYKTLQEVSTWSEYPSIQRVKMYINERIEASDGTVNYIDICCAETLEELKTIDRKAVILVSTQFGNVIELYDNIIIEPKHLGYAR